MWGWGVGGVIFITEEGDANTQCRHYMVFYRSSKTSKNDALSMYSEYLFYTQIQDSVAKIITLLVQYKILESYRRLQPF